MGKKIKDFIRSLKVTWKKNREKCIEKGLKSLQKKACDWYRGLSKEEKNEKREYQRHKYQNMSEKDKQKLTESKKNRIWGMFQENFQKQIE